MTSFKRPVSNVWPWKMCHVWGLDSIGKWVYATLNGLNYGSSVTEMFPNTDDFIRMSIKDFQWNNWQDTTIKMVYHFQDKWPVFSSHVMVTWWSHDLIWILGYTYNHKYSHYDEWKSGTAIKIINLNETECIWTLPR